MEPSELIKQVKLSPAIWSTTLKDHKKEAAAWRRICKIVWPDFDQRPVEEKRTKCLELQMKWKVLKQSYMREYLREQQGRERGVLKSPHYEQLAFLAPTISKISTAPGPESTGSSPSSMDANPSPFATPTAPERDTEEDRQFLLSLVSYMQEVPRSRKLALRTEIMQIIAKYTRSAPPGRSTPHGRVLPPISQEY